MSATGWWNRFWYAEGNTLSLGIFRALFAICLIWEIPVTRAKSLFAIEGGFHYPYVPFVKPLPLEMYHALHDWQYPFAILLMLGILPRVSAGVLLALQSYIFFADQINFRNHPYFFMLLLAFLIFSPAGQSFSVPALVRRLRGKVRDAATRVGTIAPLTIQRLIQFQVSVVYFYAAIHKMTEQYFGGHILADQMNRALFSGRSGRFLAGFLSQEQFVSLREMVADPGFWVIPAWTTVILEVALPFVLWIPRLRIAGMLFGIPFHLAIAYVMQIDIFSAAMISSYLLFLDPDTVPRLWLRLRDRFLRPAQSRPASPPPAPKAGKGKAGVKRARA